MSIVPQQGHARAVLPTVSCIFTIKFHDKVGNSFTICKYILMYLIKLHGLYLFHS